MLFHNRFMYQECVEYLLLFDNVLVLGCLCVGVCGCVFVCVFVCVCGLRLVMVRFDKLPVDRLLFLSR